MNLQPQTSPSLETVPAPAIPLPGHKRNGKVAQLSKAVRHQINTMLDDGHSYPNIIQALREDGQGLKSDHLSNWKDGGYQDYLLAQERLSFLAAQRESAGDILQDNDITQLAEASLQTAMAQLLDLLSRFKTVAFDFNAKEGIPPQYLRLLNTLPRLSREIIHLKNQRDAAAKIQAKPSDVKRKLTDEEHAAVVDHADDIFGLKSYRNRPVTNGNDPFPSVLEQGPVNDDWTKIIADHGESTGDPVIGSRDEAYGCQIQNPDAGDPPLSTAAPTLINEPPTSNEAPPLVTTPDPASASEPQSGAEIQNQNSPGIAKSSSLDGQLNTGGLEKHTTENPAEESGSVIKNQNSKFKNPEEHCPACHALLPELMPNGERPFPACWRCHARLPDLNAELCPGCQSPLPGLTSDGQRPYPDCRLCGLALPPPPASAGAQTPPQNQN